MKHTLNALALIAGIIIGIAAISGWIFLVSHIFGFGAWYWILIFAPWFVGLIGHAIYRDLRP